MYALIGFGLFAAAGAAYYFLVYKKNSASTGAVVVRAPDGTPKYPKIPDAGDTGVK